MRQIFVDSSGRRRIIVRMASGLLAAGLLGLVVLITTVVLSPVVSR